MDKQPLAIDQTAAKSHLESLGYKHGDNVYMRYIKPKTATEKSCSINADTLNFTQAESLQSQGYNAYFVVNGSGHDNESNTLGRAIFFEHDYLPVEEQVKLWERLHLPEPTIQINTGGKSIHSYWVFHVPIQVSIWQRLQQDAIYHTRADKLGDKARIFRLAGCRYFKGELQGTTAATIVGHSGKKYSYDELRDVFPAYTEADWDAYQPPKEKLPELVAKAKEWLESVATGTAKTTHVIPEIVTAPASKKDEKYPTSDPTNNPFDHRNFMHLMPDYDSRGYNNGWATMKALCHGGESNDSLAVNRETGKISCKSQCHPKRVYWAIRNNALACGYVFPPSGDPVHGKFISADEHKAKFGTSESTTSASLEAEPQVYHDGKQVVNSPSDDVTSQAPDTQSSLLINAHLDPLIDQKLENSQLSAGLISLAKRLKISNVSELERMYQQRLAERGLVDTRSDRNVGQVDPNNKQGNKPKPEDVLRLCAERVRKVLETRNDALDENIQLEIIRRGSGMSAYDWEHKIIKPIKRDLDKERFRFSLLNVLAVEDDTERIRQQSLLATQYQMSAQAIEKALRTIQQQTSESETDFYSLKDFLKLEIEGLRWVLPELLPVGETIILAGAPKSGKTLLAIDAAFAVATGEAQFLNEDAEQGRVLFVSVDSSKSSTRNQLIKRGFREKDTENLAVMTSFNLRQIKRLEVRLEEFRPLLVVVDSLKRISQGAEISENSAEFADGIYTLKETLTRYNSSGILIHHTNKNQLAMGVEKLRGSSAIAGSVWGTWQLTREAEKGDHNPRDPKRILSIFPREAEGQHLQIELDPEDFHWINHGAMGDTKKTAEEYKTFQARILTVLTINAHRQGLSSAEIIELLGVESEQRRSVRTTLARMVDRRIITQRPSPDNNRHYLYSIPTTISSTPEDVGTNVSFSTTPPSPPVCETTVVSNSKTYIEKAIRRDNSRDNTETTPRQHRDNTETTPTPVVYPVVSPNPLPHNDFSSRDNSCLDDRGGGGVEKDTFVLSTSQDTDVKNLLTASTEQLTKPNKTPRAERVDAQLDPVTATAQPLEPPKKSRKKKTAIAPGQLSLFDLLPAPVPVPTEPSTEPTNSPSPADDPDGGVSQPDAPQQPPDDSGATEPVNVFVDKIVNNSLITQSAVPLNGVDGIDSEPPENSVVQKPDDGKTALPVDKSVNLIVNNCSLTQAVTLPDGVEWLDATAPAFGEQREHLLAAHRIALDIETYQQDVPKKNATPKALHPWQSRVRLIQLSTGDRTFIADMGGRDEGALLFTLRQPTIDLVRQIVQSPDQMIVAHNAIFDLRFLATQYDIRNAKNVVDTMIGAQVYYGDYGFVKSDTRNVTPHEAILTGGYSLANLAHKFLDMTLDKTDQKSDWGAVLSTEQLKYAALDTQVTLQVHAALEALYKDETQKLYSPNLRAAWQLENDVIPCAIEIELAGMPIDIALTQQRISALEQHKADLLVKWNELCPSITYTQESKLKAHLNEKYNLNLKSLAKGSLTKATLDNPLVQLRAKLDGIDSFANNLKGFLTSAARDGRVHTTYRTLTGTGRFSSGGGEADLPNLQAIKAKSNPALDEFNLPSVRSVIKAQPGRTMAVIDLAGAHGRIAASETQDPTAIAGNNDPNVDNHLKVAVFVAKAQGYNWTAEDIGRLRKDASNPDSVKAKLFRDTAKNTYYGWLNGAGAQRIQEQITANTGITPTLAECEAAIEGCKALYPRVLIHRKELMQKLRRNAVDIDGRLCAVNVVRGGFRLCMPLVPSKYREGQLEAPYTQSIACIWSRIEATAVKMALVQIMGLRFQHPEWNLDVINYVHDEIDIEVDDAHAAVAIPRCNDIIGDSFKALLTGVEDGRETDYRKLVVSSWADK